MAARILIVDDEEVLRDLLQLAFQEAGNPVEAAESAEEALSVLRRQSFDLLLVDKNLPGMSGVDLIRKVRDTDKDVAIVMMTAYATAQSVKDTMNLDVSGYLEKPFSDLMSVVRMAQEVAKRPTKAVEPPPAPRRPTPSTVGKPAVIVLLASTDQAMWGAMAEPIDGSQARIEYASAPDQLFEAVERLKPHLIVLHAQAYGDVLPIAERVGQSAPYATTVVVSTAELPVPTLRRLVDLRVSGVFDRTTDDTYRKGVNALVQRAKLRVR